MYLKYDKLERDLYGRPEIPVMTLQTMARRTMGTIVNATPPKLDIKFSEPSEISFDVAAYNDGVLTPLYGDITGHKILRTENLGVYMLMEPETEGDGVEEVKHVKGYSIEKELEHKSFFLAEGVYNFYNPASPSGTILGRVLEKAEGWHIRRVSPSLYGKYSTIDEYDDYLLSFVYNTAPEKYRCVFVFDPYEMAIDVYDADEARRTLGIYLDYDNLVTSLDIKELSDELVTAIRAYGADGLSTLHINPTGTEWQYDLSYFIENGDIPADTAGRWKAWQASVFTAQEEYRGIVSLKASETSRLEMLKAELADLQLEMDGIIDRQSMTIQQIALEITDAGKKSQQQKLDEINAERDAKQREISTKKSQVNSSEQLVNTYNARLTAVNKLLAFGTTTQLTATDRQILSKFFIEKDITQEGFVATDVDVNVSGSLKKYGNLSFEINDSDISQVGVDINGKTIYAAHGGSFKLGSVLSGNIIRATLDISRDKSYIMSVYGGDVVYDGTKHESCVLTISNSAIGSLSSNVAESTESYDGIETRVMRGSWLRFNTGANTTTYFTTSVTEYQSLSVEMELYDYAANVLKDLAIPTYEFSVNTGNFLFAEEFEPFRDQLELGCAIRLRISEDRVVTPILIGLDIDFGNLNKLSLTFSNRFKLHDSVNTLKDMLETGYSAGRSLDASKYIYGRTVEQATQVSKFMGDALDTAKNAIVNAKNQSVSIDGAGIHVKGQGGDSRYQLRLINNMIAMTDDNWQHAKLAIGLFGMAGSQAGTNTPAGQYWGVNAEVIGGKLIVGHNLIIENVNDMGVMQFKVDATGAFLNNGTLCIQTDTKDKGKLMIDPRYGIAAGTQDLYTIGADGTSLVPTFIDGNGIKKDAAGMPENAMFYLDIRNGKAYFRGDIYADNGVFNGKVYATDGEFKGVVKATDFQTLAGQSMLKNGKFASEYLDLGNITLDGRTGDITMTGDINMSGASKINLGGIVIDGGTNNISFANAGSITWGKYEPNGIKKTAVAYAVGTSGTTAPASGWQTTVPSVGKGQYLWTRTTITYTDGTTSVSYAVGYNGTNGTVDYNRVNTILENTYGITHTQIDGTSIQSPTIMGGEIYGAEMYTNEFNIMPNGVMGQSGSFNLHGKYTPSGITYNMFRVEHWGGSVDSAPTVRLYSPAQAEIHILEESKGILEIDGVQTKFNSSYVDFSQAGTITWGKNAPKAVFG